MPDKFIFQPEVLISPYIGDITWSNVNSFCQEVLLLLGNPEVKYTHLIVPIGSSGGELDPAWCLYDFLSCMSIPVITVATGKVYSAAVMPYLAGQERYAFSTSTFLFHPAVSLYEKAEVNINQVKEEIKAEKIDSSLLRHVLELKNINKTAIKSLGAPKKSIFIDSVGAVKIGLVTQKIDKINEIILI